MEELHVAQEDKDLVAEDSVSSFVSRSFVSLFMHNIFFIAVTLRLLSVFNL